MVFVSVLLLSLVGCSDRVAWDTIDRLIANDYPAAQSITTDSLAVWLSDDTVDTPVLLDVRQEEEFAVSHIEGALRINPSTTDFTFLEHRTRDTPIVAYCSVGYRSAAIVERLQEAGFTNVHNLEGSIFKWKNEGGRVVRDGAPVDEVHPYDGIWGQLLDQSYRSYEPSDG